MIITNDQIQFVTEDFDGFSEPVKKVLLLYLEDYAAHFAGVLNALTDTAKQNAKTTAAQDPVIESILEGFAVADEAKRAAAESLLTDLDTHFKS